jgi:hypothetical protein
MTDNNRTVEELIAQWRNGTLTLAEGSVRHIEYDQIEVYNCVLEHGLGPYEQAIEP